MFLTNLAIRNRISVAVLVLLIVVAGLWAYFTLPRESAPDVPIPFILVTTFYEGVSPQDVESAVTIKIEQKLTGLRGVKELRSTSSEGMSLITLEFLPDVRVEDALQYVRDKVDQAKPDLPADAEEPTLSEINVAEFPIMTVNVSGPISPVRLKEIAEDLEDAIEVLPGVLECDLLGAREREIRLEFDPDRLAAYNISIPELIALIPSENVNISGGGLETPGMKFNVRVEAEFTRPGDIFRLPLTVRNGKTIYLQDVATVRDTFKDRETVSRLDGRSTITLNVKKRVGANILDTGAAVEAILAEARKQLPAGVELAVTLDRCRDIRVMVDDLENNILSGLVLVVGVLMLFLGFRTSLIVGLAIPLSMLISFAVLSYMGITLNMIVLFSLVLALGILVDNAIVIVENIFRYMQLGYGRIDAAKKGTAEVAWPVITSTLTTQAAFVPLLFWPGVMGNFMSYMPLTVIIVLTASLFVAMVINPVAAAVFASAKGLGKTREHLNPVQLLYRRVLRASMGTWTARLTTVALSVLALAGSWLLYARLNYGVSLFPEADPKRAIVNIRAPQGTSVDHTDLLARLAEARIEAERPSLEHVISSVGSVSGQRGFGDLPSGPHIANITLVFPDYDNRDFSHGDSPSADSVDRIRAALADLPGAEVKVHAEEMGPPTGAPVTVRIAGEDFQTLADLASQATRLIADTPGLVDLRSDYEPTRPELRFVVDRSRAMMMGLSTSMIGNFLKTSVFGREVSIYREFNDEYDITVRLPLDQRLRFDDLLRLRVPDILGRPVPLSNLGRFEYTGGKGDINRVNRKRVITLTADVLKGRNEVEALKDVQQRLTQLSLPPGYSITYAGKNEEMENAISFLAKAFAVALILIVLILVLEFNSLGIPFIIMTTVLLSLVGVFAGLLITGTPFGVIMTGIGVISLAGVVVDNAIVLLDYIRQLERQGRSLVEAVIEGGQTRLRPVLLTAITAILGLVPMAAGISFDFKEFRLITHSESSLLWAPMAVAVIYGLSVATVLTLVVVPALYATMYGLLEHFGLGGLKQKKADSE